MSGRLRLFAVLSIALTSTAGVAQRSASDLDATVKRVMAEQHVVGASVLVAQGGRVLLHNGLRWRRRSLGLDVPTKDETVYHIVGPMLPFTGVAVMQLVERGRIKLDDDLSKYVPEFPLQGRHVSIRQLLDHTSGIVDYHYLGDPIEATSRQPKALDEVMALYAGKTWVNEPGAKWDWSISGFQLLVTIVERVSGQRFADYIQKNLFEPAGLEHTTYCDDYSLVRGLSHAYRRFENGFVAANENDMAYNADLRICSTVGDLYKLWSALAANKLIRAETFKMMETPRGAAAHMNAQDPKAQYGLALTINHEDDHRQYGQHGSLFGYSGSLYEFPDDRLTVVVLSNTEGQNAYAISRALSREILGLTALPSGPTLASAPRPLDDVALSPAERRQLDGTFVLKPDRVGSDPVSTPMRSIDEPSACSTRTARLMIQTLGEGPELLLKQKDGSFARRSAPRSKVTIVVENGRASTLRIDSSVATAIGTLEVGIGDPSTFHAQLK